MKKNSVEINAAINEAKERCKQIVELCKSEIREMTDDEEKEFDDLKKEIEEKSRELEELKEELKNYDDKLPADEKEEEKIEEKNRNYHNVMKAQKRSAAMQFRENILSGKTEFKLPSLTRAVVVDGDAGVHDDVIETELEGILEPLYANNIVKKLGVTLKTGMPMGDIQYPKMTKGTVGFLGEVATAQESKNTFSHITLRPKRVAAWTEVSYKTLRQDTIGIFKSVQDDLVAKLDEYLEGVFFGDQAGTDEKPAGIFYNKTAKTVTNYKDLCDLEAELENANVNGNIKYALSPKAKSYLRSTIKGTNATGMILERNEVDGTPMEWTSNIPQYKFAFGNWKDVVWANWGDVEVKIDDSISYVNGKVRVYLTTFVDWAILRPESLQFGEVYHTDSTPSVSGAVSGAVSGSNG